MFPGNVMFPEGPVIAVHNVSNKHFTIQQNTETVLLHQQRRLLFGLMEEKKKSYILKTRKNL